MGFLPLQWVPSLTATENELIFIVLCFLFTIMTTVFLLNLKDTHKEVKVTLEAGNNPQPGVISRTYVSLILSYIINIGIYLGFTTLLGWLLPITSYVMASILFITGYMITKLFSYKTFLTIQPILIDSSPAYRRANQQIEEESSKGKSPEELMAEFKKEE